jgi:hypothetical protein
LSPLKRNRIKNKMLKQRRDRWFLGLSSPLWSSFLLARQTLPLRP